jgi:deazaflavin-dependent oxidoreductase (nitroreductase family)
MLILTRRGDDIVVGGSNGGNATPPNWYRNLCAAGRAEVQVGSERWDVTARHAEGAERDECWDLLVATYPDFATYQALTDRRIPVVVLERA